MKNAIEQLRNLQERLSKLQALPNLFLTTEQMATMEKLINAEISRRKNAGRKKTSPLSRREQCKIAQQRHRSKHIQKSAPESEPGLAKRAESNPLAPPQKGDLPKLFITNFLGVSSFRSG